MRVLDAATLHRVLDTGRCVAAMRAMFADVADGHYLLPVRTRLQPPDAPNWLTLMPVHRRRAPARWALKHMVVTPENSARAGLDPIQGVVALHDGSDGRVLAIADAPTLTTLRTAAVSALATQALARPGARIVAVLGTGIQGRSHVAAMRWALPQAEIRIWGRNPQAARALAQASGDVACERVEQALRDADVVCTTTASLTPIARRDAFAPGCHVNAVGSSRPVARELDAETIAAAALFVDRRDAALVEAGEIVHALQAGAITPAHVLAELGDVLAGRHPGRPGPGAFTIYKSLGNGAQDLAAVEAALQAAEHARTGLEVPW